MNCYNLSYKHEWKDGGTSNRNNSSELTFADIKEFLSRRGYTLLEELGEGCTRKTFLAQYNSGSVDKLRVVKIPFIEFDKNSICTIINKSKRDLDENEAEMSNSISHPHLIDVLDNFKLYGMNINVEAYFHAQSLESIIKTGGAIKDEDSFYNIFSQIISALNYLNECEGIFHRDIKSSNILVNDKNYVKISDLQNAAKSNSIIDSLFPTRGGTAFTHPSLINALMSDSLPSKANKRTEMYALGVTMFHALTGEKPFNYEIIISDKGHEIKIGGASYRIKLLVDENESTHISSDMHEEKLEFAMRKVGMRYRKILHKVLTVDPLCRHYTTITTLAADFKKLEKPSFNKFSKKVFDSIKPALMVGIGLLVGGGLVNLAIYQSNHKSPQPTLTEIMQMENYRNFAISDFSPQQNYLELPEPRQVEYNYFWDIISNHQSELESGLEKLKAGKLGVDKSLFEFLVSQSYNIHGMDRRLVSAWLGACILTDDESTRKNYESEKRWAPIFVPEDFIILSGNPTDIKVPQKNLGIEEKASFGVRYLKMCMDYKKDVAETFASYFCSDVDIKRAIINSGSLSYFPKVMADGAIRPGYSMFIAPQKRALIEKAVLLYQLSDADGKVHLDRMPKLGFFDGEYENRLSSAIINK